MKERGKWLVFDQENPDNNGIKDGEQVLVYIKNKGIEMLTYNQYYKVFDDYEGYDFYCEFDIVEKYLLIPYIE